MCASVTRRQFLSALGASVAVAAAGGYGISVWGKNPVANPSGTPLPPGVAGGSDIGRTLVVVEMGGGNDALNMVVPYATSRYYDLRKDLAVTEPLDLDGSIGLHPELGFVTERYAAGQVAVVEGVGYPDPDLSHFSSMATWWSADPAAVAQTGWLGRYLDAAVDPDETLAGVSIGPGPTPALLADTAFVVSVQDMTGLAPTMPPWIDSTDELMSMWQGFAPAAFDGAVLLDQVRAAIDATVTAADELSGILDETDEGRDTPQDGGRGRRRGDLGSFMAVAASLVTSPSPPRVIYVHGWGDFDTHEGQESRHSEMMTALNEGLAGFFSAVDAAGVSEKVIVMTTSEFGRRPAFNGSGTDHGTAGAHFVIGSDVAGGRYGEPPSLSKLDTRGNLIHTVDYRSVYATVLGGWLSADAQTILGAAHQSLPFLRK
jgi:uncharacterized protein (DUF1501 family)